VWREYYFKDGYGPSEGEIWHYKTQINNGTLVSNAQSDDLWSFFV